MFFLERILGTGLFKERIAKKLYHLLTFILCSGFCLFLSSHANAIDLPVDSSKPISLNSDIYLLDPALAASMSSELVIANLHRFTPTTISEINHLDEEGQTAIWLSVRLANPHQAMNIRWLVLNGLNLQATKAFLLEENSLKPIKLSAQGKKSVALISMASYEQRQIFFLFLPQKTTLESISLVKVDTFFSENMQRFLLKGVLAGFLILLICLSCFFSFNLKTPLFIYFSFYALFIFLSHNNYLEIFTINSLSFDFINITILLLTLSNLLFLQAYLNNGKATTNYRYYFLGLHLLNLAVSLTLPFFQFVSITSWSMLLLMIPFEVIVFTHCFKVYKDRIALAILAIRLIHFIVALTIIFIQYGDKSIQNLYEKILISLIFLELLTTFILLIKRQLDHEKQLAIVNTLNQENKNNIALNMDILDKFSHDLRTPISGIMGITEILKTAKISQSQLELVDSISHSGQILLNKVNSMASQLTFEFKHKKINKITFELPHLIEQVVYSYRYLMAEKNIELIISISHDTPIFVYGEPDRIRLVLMQLLENAINHTAQGEIIIKLQLIDNDSQEVLFSIEDTGKGISKIRITKHNHELSAFDLNENISTHLSALGSSLSINSKLGEGTEFSFILTLPKVDYPREHNEKLDSTLLQHKNLLIVDDNHTCCRVVKEQAKSFGMNAVATHDGKEAIAMFRAKRNLNESFDAIIIDYDMPYLSGIEVAEKILSESITPPIIIMLTGLNLTPPEHITQKAGIQAILTKPTSKKLLQLTLTNLFTNQNTTITNKLPNLNILIAEDNDVSRNVITKMLSLLGFQYKTVSNGQLAIEMVKKERFDLILMDCEMPVVDGFAATESIHIWQKQQNKKMTPVVALSAHTFETHKEQSQHCGMDDFLQKPVKLSDLKATLESYQKAIEPL